MTVAISPDGVIKLSGRCPSEDAEALLQLLLASPGAHVDWCECQSAHAAVIQVLMAARPRLLGPPSGEFLHRWVAAQV